MPSISSGNNSGLYDIDSVNIPIDDNITANNITATGNVTVGGYIIANGSITTNSNFVGNLVGNLIGNIALAGSNTQVIFNDSGVTGGSNAFTFNKATNAVAITGTLSATGNITGDYILGNGSQLTGLPATYSNANVVSLLASFGSNTISTSGNITGGYILGNGSQLTGLPQQYGNANVADYLASGTNTQNIVTSGTVQGNILQTAGAGGNITGVNYISANYFVGDGSLLTNVSGNLAGNMQGNILGNGFGISNIAFLSVTGASTLANVAITGGANIDVGNNRITNVATPSNGTDAATKDYVDSVSSSGFTIEDSAANTTTVAGGDTLELLGTANQVSVAITANDQVTFSLPSAISVAGNITGGNINTAGALSATGNVNAGNSLITNDLTVGGTIYGTFSGNIAGNLVVPGANTQIIFNNAGNAGASSDFTFDDGTNVMTLNGLANVTGNVQGGNITTVGLMSAAGNITANTALKTDKWTIVGNRIISPVGGSWESDEVNLDEIIQSRNDGYIDVTARYANGERGSEIHLEHGLMHLSTNPVVDPRFWYFYGNGLMTAAGDITTTGNITANYYFGNGSQLTGLPATYSNANVATFLANFGSNTISTTGDVTSGNIIANGQFLTNLPGANITGTVANATYALNANAATFAGTVTTNAQPNITSVGTLSSLTSTGNVTGGNLLTGGLISATGNITANYYFGNGSQLTGIISDYGNGNVANYLPTFTGNVGAGNVILTSTSGVAYVNNITGLAGAAITIAPDGTNDVHLDADTVRIGDNNTDATLATHGTGDLILTTHLGSAAEGNIILRDGASGNIDIQTNGSGVVNITGTAGLRVTDGISAQGNITGGNISTTGVFTASNTTANLQVANIIFNNQQLQTVGARNPGVVSATVADPGRIVIGTGYGGNLLPGNDLNNYFRGARLAVGDSVSQADNQQRTVGLATQQFVTATANITNSNTRAIGASAQLMLGGGASGNTWGVNNPLAVNAGAFTVLVGGGTSGNLTAMGNTIASVATGTSAGVTANPGGTIRNGLNFVAFNNGANGSGNIGNAIAFSWSTLSTLGSGNTSCYTGNVYMIYNAGSSNDFGLTQSTAARSAPNYYFLRNDDNAAQNKMGAMRLWHNYRYDHTTTTGNITIDKNNGQTQYIAVTGNITGITLSNFVTTASDGVNTDQEMDTVTLWLRQDATGRTITMPTGANYFYANGTTTVSTTANSVSRIEFTAIDNSGTQYLIDISQAYTST